MERGETAERAGLGEIRWREPWREAVLIAVLLLGFASLAFLAPRSPARWLLGDGPPWSAHIRRVEEALARQDLANAQREWDAAYSSALILKEWQGMAAVGEAYMRVKERTGGGEEGRTEARRIFQIAFARAQRQGSLDGVLRMAEDFAELRDLVLADLALHVAQGLAGAHPEPYVRARMGALRQRLAAQGFGEGIL